MNYKHSAYIWKLIAKLQQHELRTAREGFDMALITVTSLGALARALETQAAKIAELEAAIRRLRKVMADDDTLYCPACGCRWGECDDDCPWLTSGKLVGV